MLVFTRTKHRADRVAQGARPAAASRGAAIHGNRSQSQRQQALDGFKKGRHRVLVATDIVARGIDVDDISHVVNFDLPNVPEDYVHRIGRTARAGKSGIAISLFAPEEHEQLRDIEKKIGAIIDTADHADFAYSEARAGSRSGSLGDRSAEAAAPDARQRPQGPSRRRRSSQADARRRRSERIRQVRRLLGRLEVAPRQRFPH